MIGQGRYQERLTKISILSKKAEAYNSRFDELEQTGLPLKSISKTIFNEEKAKNERNIDVLPFDETRKVIDVNSILSLGFEKSHIVCSEAKNMNLTINQKFQRTKELKNLKEKAVKNGLPFEEDKEIGDFIDKLYRGFF